MGTLENRRKKLAVVVAAIVSAHDAAGFGEHPRRLDDVAGFVAFAAPGARREIRRVGFDENAILGELGGDLPQRVAGLEGEDSREGHVTAEGNTAPCEIVAACEAVEHERKGALRAFLFENAGNVVVGIAGVDHKRQSRFAGGGDMPAKSPLLHLARAVVVVVVEARLTDRDDFVASR